MSTFINLIFGELFAVLKFFSIPEVHFVGGVVDGVEVVDRVEVGVVDGVEVGVVDGVEIGVVDGVEVGVGKKRRTIL